MSVNNGALAQDQKHQDDYEFYTPLGSKEEQSTGKGFLYLGAALGLTGVGYMARNFKNKPKDMKISVYLIHTRLLAQGTVIGVLCLGMMNQMYQKWSRKKAQ